VSANADGAADLYASWNGATDVSLWRVLAGGSARTLTPVGQVPRHGFETHIQVHTASPYFAVQALSATGHVLSTSPVKTMPPHLAVYGPQRVRACGQRRRRPPGGLFHEPPLPYQDRRLVRGTPIARTGSEYLGGNSGGLVYFRLSAGRRRLLARARGRRLPVRVTTQDSSGASATTSVNLVPFYTAGAGPHRTIANAPTLRIVGQTDFVSNGWVGGILASCLSSSPCHVSTTLSVGSTIIARRGSESLGADELGYLMFTLAPAGHAMLAHAPTNQLATGLVMHARNATATAEIALVRFR
jgi:hypothetical protein